ncbi:MAG: cupin domain-containing protein [Lentisphaeria bacterium]|nr:cupin domain-containing protein [Lentisphaeria bacterium]
MLLRASELEAKEGRRAYDLGGRNLTVGHFVTRVTAPETPFGPHRHEQPELWFLLAGEAIVSLDGVDHAVGPHDLIVIDPWIEHGLRTTTGATWICLG